MPDESLGRVQNNPANHELNQVKRGNFKVDESQTEGLKFRSKVK